MSKLTMAELYETLVSGNKFSLKFDSADSAREFRGRLATHKFRVESPLKDMGVIEHQILRMEYDTDTCIASFYLQNPEEVQKQTFEILEITPLSQPS